jgi:hypothetical protein
MVISKQEYKRLKEYYDFQRKKQYNREQLMYEAGDNDFFDEMWSKFEEKDYKDPPSVWIPRDKKWRIEGEE